jgi:hypothetical protein
MVELEWIVMLYCFSLASLPILAPFVYTFFDAERSHSKRLSLPLAAAYIPVVLTSNQTTTIIIPRLRRY